MATSSEACLADAALESKQAKSDKAASDLMCNIAIADITKVSVDDFVKQITLIDMSYFAAIKRSEFLSLKWNGRDKKIYAPNIVESTKWFNQLNFWVQKEILKYPAVNKRTEMLSYFIKLAKHLVEVNNLYSAMSIVSALQVECVYRLRLTWSGLGHRERAAYRRLEELFGQQDNCRLLREHTAAMRLPGIPYLGLYLSDLIYTNVAHPRINGQPTTVWVTKLNTIVDAIAHFQQSRFPFQVNESIRAYLLAQSYIEELQKFLEDANFKMSLHLEPPPILDASPPPTSLSLMAPAAAANGHSTEGSRRGVSAAARVSTSISCKTAPLVVALTAGCTFEREQAPRKKTLPSAPQSLSFKPTLVALGKAAIGDSTEVEVDAEGEEVEVCCTRTIKPGTTVKLLLPPNPVGLLESSGCAPNLAAVPIDSVTTGSKACFANDTSILRGKKEFSVGKALESLKPSCDDAATSTDFKSSRVATHDQEIQVPQPHSSVSVSTSCLLCCHSSPTLSSQQERQQEPQSASRHTTDCSLSEAVPSSDSSSQSDRVTASDPARIEAPITPVSSAPPKSTPTQEYDIYSAVLAVASPTCLQSSANEAAKSRSESGASFSLSSRPKEDISQWPPTSFPFIKALRPACVLCEGPVNRKTVGRLIPPGLEQATSALMNLSTFSDDGSNSPCLFPTSFTPPLPPPTAQPQQRYPRNASWRPFWTALVVMEGWASAYMVYFDAVAKKPYRREDFAAGRCQIQPFQQCPIDGGKVNCPPNIGLARHRNGIVDETSFLLTHPGLHKTYRLRPIARRGDPAVEATGGGGDDSPHTPTPQRRDSRLFFTLSRKNSVTTVSTTPTHTPPPSASLRGWGTSAPILAAAASQAPTDLSMRPMPTVEDWLHALQATLDHLQS
ncbi:Ras-specific guanine nucleotide-releasing factor RalGPS1 [Echinococcus granulosus]|uniref:Ral guanine nucleotide exchange factor with pH n=1 Tax=Echinococcus granulosus TaxID=6210 RepID=A0A068WGU4_ECHGR|nr:Ras-specific guanine nucleotide-releasing factor RalGPS1 [Echinococcus granulosus]CDS18980.1 ral guanine nucleotide exchange factor with pH [Echinococcus granulosus]